MKLKLKYILPFIAISLFISCGGGGGDDTPPPPPPPPAVPDPAAANLVFPEDNTECNISEVLSETQSTVTFMWEASENTDTYEVNIRNLNSNTTIMTTTANTEAPITIERGTPYEWFVVSSANGTNVTASSTMFRFFNEGPGIENYAPFPADAVNPARGANLDASTTMVTLEWSSGDIDDDIIDFEVFFGTESVPTTSLGSTAANTADATVASGQTYFWRVISRDDHGNSSQSEIFQFRVN